VPALDDDPGAVPLADAVEADLKRDPEE